MMSTETVLLALEDRDKHATRVKALEGALTALLRGLREREERDGSCGICQQRARHEASCPVTGAQRELARRRG